MRSKRGVLLTSIHPLAEATLDTDDFGTLLLQSCSQQDLRPDVDSLAVLRRKKHNKNKNPQRDHHDAADNMDHNDDGFHPVKLLAVENNNNNNNDDDDDKTNDDWLTEQVRAIPGLKQRLLRRISSSRSVAATAPKDDPLSDYQVFVETAQSVFFELLRVLKRRRPSHNDRKARDDDDSISSSNTQRRKRRRRDGLLSSLDNNHDTREPQQQRLSELEKQLQNLEGDFVGQSVVDYLSDDLTRLVFCYHEDNDDDDRDGSRVHHLELQLHDFPENMLEACRVALPQELWNEITQPLISTNNNTTNSITLSDLYRCWVKTVRQSREVLNVLDEIDQTTAVMVATDVGGKTFSCKRSIALTDSVSMSFCLHPRNPRALPHQIRFEGRVPTDGVAFHSHLWVTHRSVRENLELCLGFPIQSPSTRNPQQQSQSGSVIKNDNDGAEVECAICYTSRLVLDDNDGMVEYPTELCEHKPCGRHFHPSCLREWLLSLPSARFSFDSVVGSCPYCNGPISTLANPR